MSIQVDCWLLHEFNHCANFNLELLFFAVLTCDHESQCSRSIYLQIESEQIMNSNIDIFKLMSKSLADPLIRQLLCSSRARKLVRLSHLSYFLMCFSSVARELEQEQELIHYCHLQSTVCCLSAQRYVRLGSGNGSRRKVELWVSENVRNVSNVV